MLAAMLRSVMLQCLGMLGVATYPAVGAATANDSLKSGFTVPPDSAIPPWLIDVSQGERSVMAELAWQRRVGLAHPECRIVSADAHALTRSNVNLRYMSDRWKTAFRHGVSKARECGVEPIVRAEYGDGDAGIGAPWVTPAQAMKKLVWSRTVLE